MTQEFPIPAAQEQTPLTPEEMKKRREEYVALLKSRIDDLKVEVEYQELKARLAKSSAEELQAMSYISSITNKPKQTEVEVTEEILKGNPDMEKEGIKVGDTLIVEGGNVVGKK